MKTLKQNPELQHMATQHAGHTCSRITHFKDNFSLQAHTALQRTYAGQLQMFWKNNVKRIFPRRGISWWIPGLLVAFL